MAAALRDTLAGALLGLAVLAAPPARAADADEFKVKREEVFEFTEKPRLLRQGDRVTVSFASKGWCDATIAVENADGRIVRHLASGVLGAKAPEPFQKNSLKQTVVWDGKDDQGSYIDDKDGLTVRVSLGLAPRFERNLFWSPHKRTSNACQLLAATEEGVLVFEGRGIDRVMLFGHEGEYLRTVHPFPAGKLGEALGVAKQTAPQDGRELPLKSGFVQGSLLTSGTSRLLGIPYKFGDGYAATAMATAKGRIALGYDSINRLSADGGTGGLKLAGPKIGRRAKWSGYGGQGGGEEIIGPASMAFSPDGKSLYLTGYMWREFYMGGADCLHGVTKLDYEADAEPKPFAGEMKGDDGAGTDDRHFKVPSSVACDAQGRVYVTDHMNDRVQVFAEDGKFLKSIATPRPAQVLVSPRNGEIWVFSWPVIGVSNKILRETGFEWQKVKPTLTRYGPLDNPKQLSSQPLPVEFSLQGFFLSGPMISVAVDWWAESPTVWIAARKYNISRIDVAWGGTGAYGHRDRDAWTDSGLRLFREKGGQWAPVRNFAEDAKAAVVRVKPPDFARQRLGVNPRDGKLYVFEDSGFSKSFYQMVQIDPENGKIKMVEIPFDAEELCFDLDGRAYLRTDTLVARYDPANWREVPWDYGEVHRDVGFTSLGGSKRADVISGLATPGVRPVCWNQGGMSVSPKGYLIVSCCSQAAEADRRAKSDSPWEASRRDVSGKPYAPKIFPGRVRWQELHVWNQHGQLVYEDAVPGLTAMNGVFMDREDNIYAMASPTRVVDGKPYFNEMTGTLIKFRPKECKVVSAGGAAVMPLAQESRPNRPLELASGKLGPAWAEGAKWFYGGVGWDGFNPAHSGGGCDCWNSRFALDYFARSFAPELDHYSVAVVDSNGNLILRIGRYGNVDDGKPLDAKNGPPAARALGGDEVGLFHAAYVATHTDRRLFIADAGNARILSVKLGYRAEESVGLKGVPDGAR